MAVMHRLWILTLLGLALAGCGGSKVSIAGTWKFDTASAKLTLPDVVRMNPMLHAAETGLGTTLAPVRFDFKGDGSVAATGGPGGAQSGKWTLDGDNLSVNLDNTPGKEGVPTFKVDSSGSRIHFKQDLGERGSLEADLVRA